MTAFRLAAEAGADLIEFDVHLSADDVPIVIHDDTLDRTTDGSGYVRDHTAPALRSLDASCGHAAYRGEHVPTLDELVAWARTTSLGLSLEIKQPEPLSGRPRYGGIVARVAEVLTRHGMVARTLVHSFDHPTVREMRDALPDVTTAILYGGGTFGDPLVLALPAHASGIHPWWSSVSPGVCAAAHAQGMHVHAWGMPEPPDAAIVARLVAAGVDSLDTNDPPALRRVFSGIAGLLAATTAS